MVIPALFGALGALGAAGIGAINNSNTNAANAQAVADTNAANMAIADKTNAMNQAINEQNIALVREQNAINREREDNAVRRRVNDLVGAGLSKTLAAGSAASANAMQAPQATESMVTGHAMQAAKYRSFGYDNVATAGKLVQEGLIANKELENKNRELDIRQQELDELIRHNKATEDNTSRSIDVDERYLEQQDKWNQMFYDQNNRFHDDAVKLEEAKNTISFLQYVSQDNLRYMQNNWYQAEIDFSKATTEQNAIRLTADVAESTAKCASYYSSVKLDAMQYEYLKNEIPYIAQLTAESAAREIGLNADAQNVLTDILIKEWNLSIAQGDSGKTTDTTVTESVASQNRHERLNTHLSNVTRGISLGAGVILGGAAGKFINKALGFDHHYPMGFHP